MLDKSLEFHSIIMRAKNVGPVNLHPVPEGFSVRYYRDGDELDWAKIQCAVGEFENTKDALRCFNHYLDFKKDLEDRQIYVVDNKTGKSVATATAWFSELNGKRIGVVHALSCLPEFQGMGLGKIAAEHMMDCFGKLMPGCDVWLDTQTWSYKAIGIYLELGFEIMKTETFNEVKNEFDLAMKVLKANLPIDSPVFDCIKDNSDT